MITLKDRDPFRCPSVWSQFPGPGAGMCSDGRVLKELKSAGFEPYYFREEWLVPPLRKGSIPYSHWSRYAPSFALNHGRGFPIVRGEDLDSVKHYGYEELMQVTNSFSELNFLFKVYSGSLFRGTIHSDGPESTTVIVKTWDFSYPMQNQHASSTIRVHDELVLLRDPEMKSHPNVVKLVGYHCERGLATIYYGIEPKYCMKELIDSDDFEWEHRMRLATEIGSLLKLFHCKGILHGGLDPSCIILDGQFHWMSVDFHKFDLGFRISEGGISLGRDKENVWSFRDDIVAYGLLLLRLVSRQMSIMALRTWANNWGEEKPVSVVHSCFSISGHNGEGITRLGFDCLKLVANPNAEALSAEDAVKYMEGVLKRLSNFVCNPPLKKQKLRD